MAYPDLPSEFILLRTKLTDDVITWEEALQTIQNLTSNFKSWRTNWWENTRSSVIKDYCEQCGATGDDNILVLQHTWHPRTFNDLRSQYYEEYSRENRFSDEIREEINRQLAEIEYPTRDACPQCSGIAIRYRKKVANWFCIKCEIEFVTPLQIRDERAVQQKEKEVWLAKGRERYQEFLLNSEYQKQIILQIIEESLRYYSFEDTVTYCKKCAYLADMHELILCPQCKKNYMSKDKTICYKCKYKILESY